MLLVEELAARGWPAAEALARRRLAAAPHAVAHAPALELGAPARRRRPGPGARRGLLRAPRGARARAGLARRGADGLDAALAGRGWTREGPTDVLVADARRCSHARRRARWRSRRVPTRTGWRRGRPARNARTPTSTPAPCSRASSRRPRMPGRRRPRRRARGVRARLGGAVLRRHRGERAPARHRAPRGPRADGAGPSSAARSASISRSRAPTRRARPVRGRRLRRAHTAITTALAPEGGV